MIACIDSIESERGALDIVIFNVGGNVNFPLLETTERVFPQSMDDGLSWWFSDRT